MGISKEEGITDQRDGICGILTGNEAAVCEM